MHRSDDFSRLYKATRQLDHDGSRRGIVINLTDIWRHIDVVPAYGEECPENWTTDNAVELAKEFYINPFYEKEAYFDLM